MEFKQYCSIHNHSEMSNLKLIDSINRVPQLLDYGFELGLRGVAITDHDCVSAHVKAWNYYNKKFTDEQKQNFKLILGNEIYLCREGLTKETHMKGEKFYHLILLAKDDIGLRQIRELSTRAWSRSYMMAIMRTPTYSSDMFEIIGANPGHVIATTACLGGYCGNMFAQGNHEAIERHLSMMEQLFGADNFFIELQPSYGDDQITYNNYMIANYWGKYKFVCSTDSHYLTVDDRETHKIFLNSKASGDREVDAFYASAYMMSAEEISEYFTKQGITEDKIGSMFANTNWIADQIGEYNLAFTSRIPKINFTAPAAANKLYWDLVQEFPEDTKDLLDTLQTNNPYDIKLLNDIAEAWHEKIDHKPNRRDYVVELNYEFQQTNAISRKLEQPMSSYFVTMSKMIDIMWEEGDSIVGPGRGSAASSIVNYLSGITQVDPLAQPLEMPYWRFLHSERSGLPDIDIDTEATKRVKVFNKVQEYFRNIGGDLISVCTFGTEKTKSAINTACRGLGIDEDTATYITAMVPNERGNDLTLKQCYYGDDDHNPIRAFVEQMDANPMLWKVATAIEGLITRLGCHASGVIALNENVFDYNSAMKTSSGQIVTAYNLEDTEQLGGVKFDFLTVQALDKIRTCMNLLLEDERIEWQGSLRATYNKYIHPDAINYSDQGMWDALYRKEIPSCFQFDTMVGGQAIQEIHPQSLNELVAGNGLMRLMATDDGVLPLDLYCQHKRNPSMWYSEMRVAGLTEAEIEIMEDHLTSVYGVSVSQESMMLMSMDERISGFSVGEANVLRKAVAKKKADVLQKGKELFYNKGLERGTSMKLLDYIWNKQIMLAAGYAFSDIHAVAYSYIAIQEMNLCYFYPSIYWKCACLSVDAGAVSEEDYYNLVDTGIISLTDDDDKRDQNKVQYGKMASAIIKAREYMSIALPDINVARFGFTPDVERNTIVYGLKGITRLGDAIINDIILRRPFKSLNDFVTRMVSAGGKKLISKDKVINLIKAGAFDNIENKPREQILKDFVYSVSDQKKRLNLMNFQMLIAKGLIPDELAFSVKVFNFTKYIRKMRYMGNYILDEAGYGFYSENYDLTKVKQLEVNGIPTNVISEKYWDSIYNAEMDKPRNYIKKHHDDLLTKLNNILFMEEYNKYADGDLLKWELDALSFYYSGHPLEYLTLPVEISRLSDIHENEFDGFWMIKGKQIPKYKLHTIVGAVIDKDKTKGLVTLSTPDGVVDMKIYKQEFAKYIRTVSEESEDGSKEVLEDSFFDKGTFLAVTGIMRGGVFVPKVYKSTGFEPILKIVLDENGGLSHLLAKS